MEPINSECVAKALEELAAKRSVDSIHADLEARQPHLAPFVTRAMSGLSTEALNQSYALTWLALRSFELQLKSELSVCSAVRLKVQSHLNDDLASEALAMSRAQFIEAMNDDATDQPELVDAIRQRIVELISDGGSLKSLRTAGAAQLYLTVKSVVNAFHSIT